VPTFAFEQARAHAPHASTAAAVGVSQPFFGSPSQLPYPFEQEPSAHAPAEQVALACGYEQTCPQLPQFAGSDVSAASQPFAATASQSV
jgi:hypothetical protein